MQHGIDSLATQIIDPNTHIAQAATERMNDLIEEIVHADEVGLDAFGVGEHHREEFLDSATALILAAARKKTSAEAAP